jgi:transcriptional regulator with XRE-family HTH domain
MKRHTSSKRHASQLESTEAHAFALRLREERIRIEPNQRRFADRLGITAQKQSFLENGDREIRADYLASISSLGIDILYVITGQRTEAAMLTRQTTILVDAFELLTPDLQSAAATVVQAMADGAMARRHPPSGLNETQSEYRAEQPERR